MATRRKNRTRSKRNLNNSSKQGALKNFVSLIQQIESQSSSKKRIDALVEFFEKSEPADRLWCIALFTGKRPKRAVKNALLKSWCAELAQLDDWLFEESYHVVGDLAETMALLVPFDGAGGLKSNLNEQIKALLPMKNFNEEEQKEQVLAVWKNSNHFERFVFNKLLTGGWRIGVAKKNLIKALAIFSGQDETAVAHRLMGNWDPSSTTYHELMESDMDENLARPYPFYLAYSLENDLKPEMNLKDWQFEWKWDGIRGQIVKRGGECFVWTRGEELVSEKYPELMELGAHLENGTVLDGEIVVHDGASVLPFQLLQTRISRKTLPKKLLAQAPVKFIAYDQLEANGEDIRALTLEERRRQLIRTTKKCSSKELLLSESIELKTWQDYEDLRLRSRAFRAEGFMLKRKTSPYENGRKKGNWWKWKLDPLSIDAVLIYAMRGHGRRANLFTDYTFAVWQGEELVPFAKAYSGLTDAEFKEVDRFMKKNTVDKFGPVRSVKPELVFELAFEGIAHSSRHKSGIALRFPRMARWRKDKTAQEANSLEDLRTLLQLYEQQPSRTMSPKSHLIQLVQVVKADENIDAAELKIIQDYAKKHDLSIEDALKDELPQMEKGDGLKSWYHLLYTCLADGEISPSESASLMEIGVNMGLDVSALRKVIELSHQNGAVPLTDEELNAVLD